MLKPYSVLLLYPNYANENGNDTYFTHVETANAADAVEATRQEASKQTDDCPAADFALLAVFDGHLENLVGKRMSRIGESTSILQQTTLVMVSMNNKSLLLDLFQRGDSAN